MDDEKTDKLVAAVMEQLQSDEDNLNAAVDIAIDFSKQNSIAPEILLNCSSTFGSNATYAPTYVFSKAAANLSEGKIKVDACFSAGTAAYFIGRNEEAEEQYKIALGLDPSHENAHSNYGLLLNETGRNEEAEEQYKMALAIDPNHVNTHYNYGRLLKQTGRNKEAEEQYKMVLSIDPNDADTHSNYGLLLSELERNKEAEEQYKMALAINPNHVNTHSNYGLLLSEMRRNKEAEEQYKMALSIDPNDADTHFNYGVFLSEMGRNKEVEEQYKMALAIDPNHVNTHSNYGLLLSEMERNDEAEKQYKMALGIDPDNANAHGAYGFLLFDIDDDKKALAEIKTASQLFREKNDNVMEHLALAWLYEKYAERYYKRGTVRKYKKERTGGYFRKSGEYAELAGDEYIMASKYAGDEGKGLYLSQGYTLKGRSEIRKIELSRWDENWLHLQNLRRDDYDKAKFELIMDGVKDAAGYYKEAAKHSPKRNAQCDVCSNCMSALGSMLDYMLSVINQRTVPELSEKIKEWDEVLSYAKMVQQKSEKGDKFVEALQKFIPCIYNLEKYKNTTRHEYKKALNDCMSELKEVASNIEGPLQEIIDSSAHQMKKCMLKHKLYTSGADTDLTKNGAISKITDKVLDKIYGKIAAVIVAVLFFIALSLLLHMFG